LWADRRCPLKHLTRLGGDGDQATFIYSMHISAYSK
jgi:hypothetical protein